MRCYSSEAEEGDDRGVGLGRELRFPATVVRGDSVSCFVNAFMPWNERDDRLQLVITDCRFTTAVSDNRTALTYHFIRNKYVVRPSLTLAFSRTSFKKISFFGLAFDIQ